MNLRFPVWSLFLLFFCLRPVLSIGQDLGLLVNQEPLTADRVMSPSLTWADPSSKATLFMGLTSISDTIELSFEAWNLQEKTLNRIINKSQISITPAQVTLLPGKSQQIQVDFGAIPAAGRYEGTLVFSSANKDWQMEIPVDLSAYLANQVTLAGPAQGLNVYAVDGNWLQGILPPKLRQRDFTVTLENSGETPLFLNDHSLSLLGANSGVGLSSQDLNLRGQDSILDPGEIQTVSFRFDPKDKLVADSYVGQLRLHFDGYQGHISVPVNLYARIGVLGALITLLLGIAVGRMMKDVNSAQPQLELFDQLIPIQNSIDDLKHDEVSIIQLRGELKKLEKEINQVTTEAQAAELAPKLVALEQKAEQITRMEQLYVRVNEQFTAAGPSITKANRTSVLQEFNSVRDEILAGASMEAIDGSFEKLQVAVKEATASSSGGSRSILGDDNDRSLTSEMQKTRKGLEEFSVSTQSVELSGWEKFQNQVLRFLNFVSGIKVSARVRYGLFRPIIGLTTFIVLVLLGFQEIYIDGGATFGAEGVYDYLKLFLWGIISDVFSRSLAGSDAGVQRLMSKNV